MPNTIFTEKNDIADNAGLHSFKNPTPDINATIIAIIIKNANAASMRLCCCGNCNGLVINDSIGNSMNNPCSNNNRNS